MGNNTLTNWFEAPKITYEQIKDISKNSPEIIVWAAPVMFFFVLLEWYISYKENKQLYKKAETLGSVLVGIGNVTISFALKFVLLSLIVIIYNLVPLRMYFNCWALLPC